MKRSLIYSITVLLAAGLVSSCTKTESTTTTAPEKAPAKYEKPSKKYPTKKYPKPTPTPKDYDKPTPTPKEYDKPTPTPKKYATPTPTPTPY